MDLDGTALRTDGTISGRLKEAVRHCLERGVRVILATGRMAKSAQRFWAELELPPGPLVAYQGAMVVWVPEGRVATKVTLPDEGARRAVEWALAQGLLTQVYVGTELWVSREDARVRSYIDANHIPAWVRLEPEMTDWPEPPIKVLLQGDGRILDSARPDLESIVAPYPIRVFKSQSDYLELVHCRVGKSVGLEAAARVLEIAPAEVLAIGDAENDLDMLRWAGFGVAMGQAPDQVKRAADWVTDSVDEDGAAAAIERWVLEMTPDKG